VHFIKRNYEILYKEKSFWHACNYIHVDFDWPRKKHTEFVLQCSTLNFLAVFGIKIIKSPKGKAIHR
jgi:hypothetical protein